MPDLAQAERSLWDTARMIEEKIASLEADRDAAATRAGRRPINQRIHSLRGLLDWVKSRAGYVESGEPQAAASASEASPI